MSKNTLRTIATNHGRDYITPEDISRAYLADAKYEDLAEEFLSIMGRCSPEHHYGFEDRSLCAFVLIEYKDKKPEPFE